MPPPTSETASFPIDLRNVDDFNISCFVFGEITHNLSAATLSVLPAMQGIKNGTVLFKRCDCSVINDVIKNDLISSCGLSAQSTT